MAADKSYPPVTPKTYKAVLLANSEFEFVSAHTIFPYRVNTGHFTSGGARDDYTQEVFLDDESIFKNTYKIDRSMNSVSYMGEDIGFSTILKNNGHYKVVYSYFTYSEYGTTKFTNTVTYNFSVVENKLPLKKWTITDVINRVLDLCEPIRKGEKPRFRLNGMRADGTIITPENKQEGEEVGQAYLFEQIRSPQFSFTRQTLRECLQQIGGVVHGEPRLTAKLDEQQRIDVETLTFTNGKAYVSSTKYSQGVQYYISTALGTAKANLHSETYTHPGGLGTGTRYYLQVVGSLGGFGGSYNGTATVYYMSPIYYYEVSYDMYGANKRNGLAMRPYIQETVSQIIDRYLTHVDSSVDNLVNTLDKYTGVISEPDSYAYKTVRAEQMYIRISETNMQIATQFPIYTVEKLEAFINGKPVDISAYLFESSVYNSQLTSYEEQYPYSKAYALYYTQGGKNIGGLNYKVEGVTQSGSAYKNYSIVNILRQATGNKELDISNYASLAFRVTYTPFYNARVAQTKQNPKEFPRAAGLVYNQSANIIESRYYGENLKGVVARLGNVEKSKTFILSRLGYVPKAGQLYDDNYYIAAVTTEIMPTYIKCTVGLSKDFNRLSQYIGVNSEKRYSEISQGQAVERNTLWREYIVVGKQETPDKDCRIGKGLLTRLADTFTQDGEYKPLSTVCAWGSTDKTPEFGKVNLPVISSAFGNSISFSWEYEDNYSAGAQSQHGTAGNVSGYFQNNVPYTDYYGKVKYYHFSISPSKVGEITSEEQTNIGYDLPKAYYSNDYFISTENDAPYLLRKDNREILQCNFQIDFVTNTDIIIGSALASYCPAVRGSDKNLKAMLYVFDKPLNKFTDHVEAFENVKLSNMESVEVTVNTDNIADGYFTVNAGAFPVRGKSWAIVTAQYEDKAKEVEDEQGNPSFEKEIKGGDLLIGQNIEVMARQKFTPIYFTKKREVFDKSVWKDIK